MADNEAEGRSPRRARAGRQKKADDAAGDATEESTDQRPASVREAIQRAVTDLQLTMHDLHLRAQREDFDARLAYSRTVQEAQLDLHHAEGQAQTELMGALQAVTSSEEYATVALERGHEFERTARQRQFDAQLRVAEATERFQQAAQAACVAFAEETAAAQLAHVGRLKEIWAVVDPETVDPQDLAALGQATTAAARSLPAARAARLGRG